MANKEAQEVRVPGILKGLNKNVQGRGLDLPTAEPDPVKTEEVPQPVKVETSGYQWQDFLAYAQQYNDATKNGEKREEIQVWLDADVKYTLDAIRQAGVKIPVKHLLSASVRVFLESNAADIKALMEKKPKMII